MSEEDYDDFGAFDEAQLCHHCGGDGYITLDMDTIDDPVNMCDWTSGGEFGETVKCTCCGGSGLAKDCVWW